MIVWVLVLNFWGYGDGWHRSAPFYDEAACAREAARVVGRSMAVGGIPNAAYCEQVRLPARDSAVPASRSPREPKAAGAP